MVDLSVILPCYNEGENVKRIPAELIKELDKLKLGSVSIKFQWN
jgi:glycosyltransferase involved in cell wall biosynthesis